MIVLGVLVLSVPQAKASTTLDDLMAQVNSLRQQVSSLQSQLTAAIINVNKPIMSYTLTYAAGSGGSISGTTPQTVSIGGSGSPITVTPNHGYIFTGWSDGSTANPRTDANVTGNVNVTAGFTSSIYHLSYTLTYAAGSGGSISGTTPQTVSIGGSGSPITVTPYHGYVFTGWSDGSTANPRTDTNVTGNISVTAIFTNGIHILLPYTLTYTAGSGGSITGTTPQMIMSGGSSTPVTAVPSSGYSFTGWSDGATANPRTDTNVTRNISVTAEFSYAYSYNGNSGNNYSYNYSTYPLGCTSYNGYSTITGIPCTGNSNSNLPPGSGCTPGSTYSVTTGQLCPTTSTGQMFGSGVCPAILTITDNLKNGARNGQYNSYNHGVVSQVDVLQKQLNRVLAASYNQAAGPVDGKFGPLTKLGVERLQMALNNILKPNPLLTIDGVIGPFTRMTLNNSCGGM